MRDLFGERVLAVKKRIATVLAVARAFQDAAVVSALRRDAAAVTRLFGLGSRNKTIICGCAVTDALCGDAAVAVAGVNLLQDTQT